MPLRDKCSLNSRVNNVLYGIYHCINDILYFVQNTIGKPNDNRRCRIDLCCNFDISDILCVRSVRESPSNYCQASGNGGHSRYDVLIYVLDDSLEGGLRLLDQRRKYLVGSIRDVKPGHFSPILCLLV
jgi:hypothetical protein